MARRPGGEPRNCAKIAVACLPEARPKIIQEAAEEIGLGAISRAQCFPKLRKALACLSTLEVLRDARQEHKGMKKQQKQARIWQLTRLLRVRPDGLHEFDSMNSALISLNDLLTKHLGRPVSTTEALVEVFDTSC